jgi:hypothetical protein
LYTNSIARAPDQKSGLPLVFSSFKVTKNKRKGGINFRERCVERGKFYKGSNPVTERASFFPSHDGLMISVFLTSHQKA